MNKILIVGHSDADGHVIAEQTRRNLSLVPSFNARSFVHPKLTKGHQSWKTVDQITEIRDANIVIFVDMMFSPVSFATETASFNELAQSNPEKLFIIIDHHPLPRNRLSSFPNVRAVYRPKVVDCTIGPRSDLMVLAALDENQESLISDRVKAHFKTIVLGLRRAAAYGGELQGSLLSALIRFGCWDKLYELGLDDKRFHRLVRGMRPKADPTSKLYKDVVSLAGDLAKEIINSDNLDVKESNVGNLDMAFDAQQQRFIVDSGDNELRQNTPHQTRDLEAIVTLLELSAITLSDSPESTFSMQQLLECARTYAGDGLEILDEDVSVVLEKTSFLKQTQDTLQLK